MPGMCMTGGSDSSPESLEAAKPDGVAITFSRGDLGQPALELSEFEYANMLRNALEGAPPEPERGGRLLVNWAMRARSSSIACYSRERLWRRMSWALSGGSAILAALARIGLAATCKHRAAGGEAGSRARVAGEVSAPN